jgi:hypothetical protein
MEQRKETKMKDQKQGDVWIPYTPGTDYGKQQMDLRESMIDTGEYIYHDARKINGLYFWILRKLSKEEIKDFMKRKVLSPEKLRNKNSGDYSYIEARTCGEISKEFRFQEFSDIDID